MRISRIKQLIHKLPAEIDKSWLAEARLEILASVRNTAVASVPRNPRRLPSTFYLLPARLTAALLSILILLGGGATVLAAQGTIPGEALYPLKRAAERVLLAVPASAEQKVGLQARLAERRLQEVAKLFDKKEKKAEDAALSALAEFDDNLEAATDELPKARPEARPRASGRLDKAFLRHQELLRRLEERDLQPEARAAVLRALGNLPRAASGTPRVLPFTPSEVRKKDVEKRTETEKEDQSSRDARSTDEDRRQED